METGEHFTEQRTASLRKSQGTKIFHCIRVSSARSDTVYEAQIVFLQMLKYFLGIMLYVFCSISQHFKAGAVNQVTIIGPIMNDSFNFVYHN